MSKIIDTKKLTNLYKHMNIKPLSDHILIEPIKEEEKTKAGILLPDTAERERESN
ncbi:unnamed protein product [marine sediment metagenome]|uniref:10 kDa chaperonin n=1 Tax=marine sediment metagenome TaxID=412755 RepID=X1NV44_9ZZZZ